MKSTRPRDGGQSGQAMVESALTLPLMVFLILGMLQLFLMLQGRLMAEYAAFRATRVGSVRHGDCQAMTHAAILALMPTYHSFLGGSSGGGTPAQKLAMAFAARRDNRYAGAAGAADRVTAPDGNHTGAIVWIIRDNPLAAGVPDEDQHFDQFDAGIVRLETRLVYWFPLRVPFANWVIARLTLARWGWRDYSNQNPLIPTERARWAQGPETIGLEGRIRDETLRRLDAAEYVIPIHASASLRMMTPVRRQYFATQNCPPAPEAL